MEVVVVGLWCREWGGLRRPNFRRLGMEVQARTAGRWWSGCAPTSSSVRRLEKPTADLLSDAELKSDEKQWMVISFKDSHCAMSSQFRRPTMSKDNTQKLGHYATLDVEITSEAAPRG